MTIAHVMNRADVDRNRAAVFFRDYHRDETKKAIEAGNPDAAARAATECARWARRIRHAD